MTEENVALVFRLFFCIFACGCCWQFLELLALSFSYVVLLQMAIKLKLNLKIK